MLKQTIINTTEISPSAKLEWFAIPLGLFFFVIIVVTIVGNVLVLTAVKREKRLQTSFNFYIVNLALTDIGVAVTAMTLYGASNVLGFWPFGHVMCGIWIFFDYGTTFASVFTLLLISIDRFWSVTWSLHYRKHNNRRKTVVLIAASWVLMILMWLPACVTDRLIHEITNPQICKWHPSHNKIFVVLVAIIGHHGSCLVLFLCYIRIFVFIWKRQKYSIKHAGIQLQTTENQALRNDAGSCSSTQEHKVHESDTEGVESGRLKNSRQISSEEPLLCSKDAGTGSSASDQSFNNQAGKSRESTTNVRRSVDGKRQKNKERRIFITLTYVLAGYFVCWVPFHFIFDISATNPKVIPESAYTFGIWMTYLNSTINPFLYNAGNKEFRRAFKRLLCKTN